MSTSPSMSTGGARRFLLSGVLICCAAAGAAFPAAPAADQRAMDRTRLISMLRAAGVPVERRGSAEQPFLPVNGVMLKVHGEDVQVFQFRDAAAADQQADAVSPDGSTVGTAKIHWIGSPHFYKKDRLLVLYVGEESKVLEALQAVLGPPFAAK
jgi:hypothetical protein